MHEVRQADPRLQRRPLPGDRAAGEVLCRPGPGVLRPAGARPGIHRCLHEPRGDVPEAVHVWRHHPEQGLSLHSAQIEDPVLRARTPRPSFTSATNRRPTRRSISRPATRRRWRSKARRRAAGRSPSRTSRPSTASPPAAGTPRRPRRACSLCKCLSSPNLHRRLPRTSPLPRRYLPVAPLTGD